MDEMKILSLDIGSTTTKARLFVVGDAGGELIASADSPTTVEAPEEDVMVGITGSVESMQRRLRRPLLDSGEIIRGAEGVDLLTASSSAGGGLQLLVTGVWRKMTVESAQRAALGAGGVVLAVHHVNDGRLISERINQMRTARPDMILMTGGTEGGQVTHVVNMAEWISSAAPRPRFGDRCNIPLIYAGNSQALPLVKEVLRDKVQLHVCANLRPRPGVENLEPVRNQIQRLFMEHVMGQAPGYTGVSRTVDGSILPTPGAFGIMMRRLAEQLDEDMLGVDIGGATTDIFSVVQGEMNRTVSANLGMSYSISNVISSAGQENIGRWLPFEATLNQLREWAVSKMIRPTTLPQTPTDLLVEHASAREAMRLALQHHRQLVVDLKGKRRPPSAGLSHEPTPDTKVDLSQIGVIVGSGGVLSHAGDPRRGMGMLVDAFSPQGLTRVLLDRGFMMPHLGTILNLQACAALMLASEVLISAGWCLAPVKNTAVKGDLLGEVQLSGDEGYTARQQIRAGEMRMLQLPSTGSITLTIDEGSPAGWGVYGSNVRLDLWNEGEVLLLDGRKRPVGGHADGDSRPIRVEQLSMFGYQEAVLKRLVNRGWQR